MFDLRQVGIEPSFVGGGKGLSASAAAQDDGSRHQIFGQRRFARNFAASLGACGKYHSDHASPSIVDVVAQIAGHLLGTLGGRYSLLLNALLLKSRVAFLTFFREGASLFTETGALIIGQSRRRRPGA
jgi:hypothetical protein